MVTPSPTPKGRGGGFSAALHLIGAQIVSRAVTFILNILIARSIDIESYGLMLHFYLITTSILFLSREGIRRGAMRAQQFVGKYSGSNSSKEVTDFSLIVGVTWIPLVLALPISYSVCKFAANISNSDASYSTSVWLHGLAALIELLAEPFYIATVSRLQLKARGYTEALALGLKSITILAIVKKYSTIVPVTIAFAYGQMAYAISTVVAYALLQRSDALRLTKWALSLPLGLLSKPDSSKKGWGPVVDWDVLKTSGIFGVQAVQKHFLAEGEKFVLVGVQSQTEQGIYSLVNNLGSLVARLVFQPIEEAAFATFSAAAHVQKPAASSSASGKKEAKEQETKELSTEALSLIALSRAVIIIGLAGVTFGPPNSKLVVHLLYSSKWSQGGAPALLGHYCVYLFAMSLNGITEAFVHAVASGRNLAKGNAVLFLSSLSHLALCFLLVRKFGSKGLVWANSINMAIRSTFSLFQIQEHFTNLKDFSITALSPSPPTLLALLGSGMVMRFTGRLLLSRWESSIAHLSSEKAGRLAGFMLPTDALLHLSICLFLLVVCTGMFWLQEYKLVIKQRNQMKRHGTLTPDQGAAAEKKKDR